MRNPTTVALLIMVLCLLSGCRASTRDSQTTSKNMLAELSGEESGPNRCTLLTDDEVRDAMGAHSAGTSDVGNYWGLQSCRRSATGGQKDAMFAEWIEVALFWKSRESWARKQARGDPVEDFVVKEAKYDESSGENCGLTAPRIGYAP